MGARWAQMKIRACLNTFNQELTKSQNLTCKKISLKSISALDDLINWFAIRMVATLRDHMYLFQANPGSLGTTKLLWNEQNTMVVYINKENFVIPACKMGSKLCPTHVSVHYSGSQNMCFITTLQQNKS